MESHIRIAIDHLFSSLEVISIREDEAIYLPLLLREDFLTMVGLAGGVNLTTSFKKPHLIKLEVVKSFLTFLSSLGSFRRSSTLDLETPWRTIRT